MDKNARVRMARVVHWYQESHRRTLMLIQPGQSLASLELLYDPPGSSDLDQGGQRDMARAVVAVERQLAGVTVAADQ